MNVEKIEVLGINVRSLDEAIIKFSNLLGTTFHKFASGESASVPSLAIDRNGLIELIELGDAIENDSVRSIHFKVPNLEDAVQEMKLKGYSVLNRVRVGNLKEAIFSPDDFFGLRWCLIEYDEPTLVDAMLAGQEKGNASS